MFIRTMVIAIFALSFSGCATVLNMDMREAADGRSIEAFESDGIEIEKLVHCQGLIESDELVFDYMKNRNLFSRYDNAARYDENAAQAIFSEARTKLWNKIKMHSQYNNGNLYLKKYWLGLENYDAELGGFPVSKNLEKTMMLSKPIYQFGIHYYADLSPQLFIDDYDLEYSPLWASIYGFNTTTKNGWDTNGNRVYKPQTVFKKGKINAAISVPIKPNDKDGLGLVYNEKINKFVLRVTELQTKTIIAQAVERETHPTVALKMAFEINGCAESNDGKQRLLTGEVIEAKTYMLDRSNPLLLAFFKIPEWGVGELISHWKAIE